MATFPTLIPRARAGCSVPLLMAPSLSVDFLTAAASCS